MDSITSTATPTLTIKNTEIYNHANFGVLARETSIDGENHTYMHCRVWRDDVGNYQNYLSFENSGIITITSYSLSGRLVSGTFSGSVRNYQEPHDTIQIRNGRFDFKWDTLDETDFP